MRIAYFSPLPPSTSGIADYSATLLPELARHAEIDLYWDGSTPLSHDFRVRPIRAFETRRTRYDATLYHLGNSPYHGAIFDTLLRHPGIVVLHDGTLHHFFVDRTLHRSNVPGYLREMAYAHGERGYDAAVLIARGAGIFPFYAYPLLRRAVDLASGVIIHSDTIRRAVSEARPDVAVSVIAHLAFPATPPKQPRASLLARLGWSPDSFVVASFGQVSHGKRAEVVLDGFARFAAQEPRARLMWVGERSPEYDLQSSITQGGLADKVILTGRVQAAALPDYLALADVGLHLRFPTTGEASGAVMRLLAYGKPTLVSKVGWFAELPSDVVVKIPVGHSEVEAIAAHLARLANHRAHYARMSAAAREYAAARTPARAAREYLDFTQAILNEDHARAA